MINDTTTAKPILQDLGKGDRLHRKNQSKYLQTPQHQLWKLERRQRRDFPGGTVVKNPPVNAGDTGSSPGPRRSHMPRSN